MTVTIKLTGPFRKYVPAGFDYGSFEFSLAESSKVFQLLAAIDLPQDLPKIVLVNGHHAHEDTMLRDGDRVSVFAPLTGGK